MKLAPGARLGPYEIVAPIGAGGMGEVYRATDTRLGRTVAVKVLPAVFAHDAKLKMRFQGEAKAISALSHPNICSLFDVGDSYLVMEYCEGKTLAKRIVDGPLPIHEVIEYGIQIAEALASAHLQGIVHRDLKPSNIMLTRTGVKLLDFGLAIRDDASEPDDATEQRLTDEGSIPGTVQYMAPEVLQGSKADARSDIFSLGLVIYEMVTGKPAFSGSSKASMVAAILERDPPAARKLRSGTPAHLDRVITACLQKDPAERIQAARDAAIHLHWNRRGSRSRIRDVAGYSAATLLLLVLGLKLAGRSDFWLLKSEPARPPRVVPLTSQTGYEGLAALSSDGRMVAFVHAERAGGAADLYVKIVGDASALRLTATPQQELMPTWRPDGSAITFLRELNGGGTEILSISPLGGQETLLAKAEGPAEGIDYSPDGRWVAFSDAAAQGSPQQAVFLLSIDNGSRRRLTTPTLIGKQRVSDVLPTFSPDGKRVAFLRRVWGSGGSGAVCIQAVDETAATVVVDRPGFVWDVDWSPDGRSLILAAGITDTNSHLVRIPLDSGSQKTLVLWPLNEQRDQLRLPFGDGARSVDTAGNRLVFTQWLDDANIWRASGPAAARYRPAERWIASTRAELMLAFSPTGRHVAFISDRTTGTWEVWRGDADGSNAQPLTSLGHAIHPQWSPDGTSIAFSTVESPGVTRVCLVDARGGVPRRLALGAIPGWGQDGRHLYFQSAAEEGWQISKVDVVSGVTTQVTRSRGLKLRPREAGGSVYYVRLPGREVWSVSPEGGDEKLVLPSGVLSSFAAWTVWKGKLVYVTAEGDRTAIDMKDLESGDVVRLHSMAIDPATFPMTGTLDVSADGEWIAFGNKENQGSDLVLVENPF